MSARSMLGLAVWVLGFLSGSGATGERISAAESSQSAAVPLPEKTNTVYQIDLPAALQLAGAQNLDIRIAREKLAEARAHNESATWQFFPWIAPGVTWRRHDHLIQDIEGNIIDAHKQSYTVGPTVLAQLDLGDAIYKKLAAHQLVKAADFGLDAQRQDSALAAAQGYFDLVNAHAGVGVAEEAVGISTNYSGQVEQAVAAGIAFTGDLLRVRVQTEKNHLTLRQAREQQRIAAARLAQVLRLDPKIELIPRESDIVPLDLVDFNSSLDSLVALALASRPELKQNRALVDAARDGHKGALYGPLIPSLGAQVFLGGLGGGKNHYPDTFGESEDYQLTLGWRIGPGGLLDRGRVRAAEARMRVTALSGEKLLDEITRQVVEAQTRAQSLADQFAIARRAIEAAEETLRLTQGRKEFGVGAVLENVQAEQDLTQARLDYLKAVAEYNKAQYGLSKAIGKIDAETAPKKSY